MNTFFKRSEAIANLQTGAFCLLWNKAESEEGRSFFVLDTPEEVSSLMRRSIERGVTMHFHEALLDVSKIFFDIDIQIPVSLISNERVKQYCQDALSDNGEGYAADHLGYFQSSLEQFIVYTVQDAITQHYATTFSQEFAVRNFVFAKPLADLEPVERMVYMKDLDYLFDSYRNSRQYDEQTYKISWHLVFCANEFCMLRSEQRAMAEGIITLLNQSLRPLADRLTTEEPSYTFPFGTFIDEGIYTGSNIRMLTQCRESEKHASSDRKCAIQIGGEFIRSQRHLILQQSCKASAQFPHRALISCTTRRDGTELDYITRGLVPKGNALSRNTDSECDLPIPWEQLHFVLGKMGIKDAQKHECRNIEGPVYRVLISDHNSPCPVCAPHKPVGYELAHSSDRMMVIINTKQESVRFSCFRIDSYLNSYAGSMTPEALQQFKLANRSILLDFEGERFFSEYDIGRGLYRHDDTEDLVDSERLAVNNDPFSSTTNALRNGTLGSMVRRYEKTHALPGALSRLFKHKSVHQAEVEPYPAEARRLYVKSHMGTGKTKQLFEYMLSFVKQNPEARVYIVTFRVTFAQDMLAKLNAFMAPRAPTVHFVSYTDVRTPTLDQQYLIVQVESLNRVKITGTKCGLLVLDESESIYEQLSSGLSEKEIANMVNFKALVRFSTRVVAMDAYLQERTLELTERFAQNAKSDAEIDALKPCPDAVMISNSWQRKKQYVVYKGKGKKDLWLADIIRSMERGEKVVIPCASALIAKAVNECLVTHFNGRFNIQLFTQDTNERKRIEDLKDVQKAWMAYDALIYSPTISAGISFEREHYDRMFAFFDIGVVSLETFFQMMGRVRNISTNCRHVLIAGLPQTVPTTTEAIDQDFVLKRNNAQVPPLLERILFDYDPDLNVTVIKNDDYRIAVHNVRCRNLSSAKPFSRFYWMVGDQARVFVRKSLPGVHFQYSLDKIAKKIKAGEFELLKSVQLPEDIESYSFFEQPKSPEEALRRRKLEHILAIGLQRDNVGFFDRMANERQYKAWQNKFHYMQQRIQLGTFRDMKQLRKVGNTLNTKSDTQTALGEVARSEALEMILKVCGLNQDILDPSRFSSKCRHKDCKCIKQPIRVVDKLITDFMASHKNVESLLKVMKESDTSMSKFVLDTKPGSHEVIKRLNCVLRRLFRLQITKTSKLYILRHTDEFMDFLSQDPKIKAMTFSDHKPDYSKALEAGLTDRERLYVCDYNYFYLPEDQRLTAIRTDLDPLLDCLSSSEPARTVSDTAAGQTPSQIAP